MANTSILNAFERMWQHVVVALGGKADSDHSHTASEIGAATSDHTHTVDSALSTSSTNPVQNKVVNAAIATVQDKLDDHTGNSDVHFTATERTKLSGIAAGAQVNTVTGIKGNSESSYRTGNINITKANIGLGNVDNTSDANKPVSTAQQTAIDTALESANSYTDTKIDALVGEGASETLDTIGEISKAIEEHQDVTDALNSAIGTKANASDLTSHTGNTTVHLTSTERTNWNTAYTHSQATHARTDATKVAKSETNGNILINGTETTVYTHPSGTNPHGTTKADVGLGNVDNTADSAKTVKAAATLTGLTATVTELNYVDGVTSNIQTQLNSKAASSHTHSEYVNQNAFGNVVVGETTIAADSATDSLTLVAGSNVTITPDATNDKITIAATNTTYGAAGTSLGLVKSGGDVTISSGVITVNDDSHAHVIDNVDGLQAALDGKAASSHGNHVPTTETASNSRFLRNDNTWATVTPANIGAAASSHGTHVSFSTTAPVMNGTAAVGTATTVSRSDHVHPTDTSRAAASHTHSSYVNQNAFSNFKVGDVTIAADTTTDTLTVAAGSNITLTPDADNDKLTIAATNTTYSAGTGISLSGTTFSNAGVRSIATGSTNGTISVNTGGTTAEVAVKGLGSAAYTASSAYATSGHTHSYLPLAGGTLTGNTTLSNTSPEFTIKNTSNGTASLILERTGVSSWKVLNTAGNLKIQNNYTDAVGDYFDVLTLTYNSGNATFKGTVTAASFSGSLSGNATTATTATTANKVTNSLIVKLNGGSTEGTNLFTFNGSAAKTINITPSSIGASATSHTHSSYVNQNAFSNVKVSDTTIAADTTTDTLTIVAGSNITLTPDADNDKLTITATNTTYSAGTGLALSGTTFSNSGVRSISAGSNGIIAVNTGGTSANVTVYTLPTASSSTLGGVKTTSTVTSNSGYTACPIIGGVPYYKDTNTTYSLSSFGITATAAELNALDGITATVAELNYVDGVTSSIQTQINNIITRLSALEAVTHTEITSDEVADLFA